MGWIRSGRDVLIAWAALAAIALCAVVVANITDWCAEGCTMNAEAWASLVGGALAFGGACIGGFIVFQQIERSDRNHKEMLDEAFRRDVAAWERTDGMLERQASSIERLLNYRKESFYERNPRLWPGGGVIYCDIPEAWFPDACLRQIEVEPEDGTATSGAAPGVALAFKALLRTVHNLNQIAESENTAARAILRKGDKVLPSLARMYSDYLLEALNNISRLNAEAKLTRPRRRTPK